MPTVIDWTPTVDPSEVARQTRDALSAGGAAVLPGDAGYLALWPAGATLELPDAALLVWGPDEAAALGLSVPPAARRLMLRAWPAALIVEVPARTDVAAAGANGFARLRFPDHPLFESVVPALAGLGPVLVADLGTTTAGAAAARLGERASLVVDAGPRPSGAPPTVVRAAPPAACAQGTGSGAEIVRPGAFPAYEIERLAARLVLFVCTGNTCRSPMAEVLAKKLLANRLGCAADELPARGFWVLSAGVATYGGGPAAEDARAVVAEFGADLSGHASRPVNPQLLLAADDVIAMTRGHLHALDVRFPGLGPAARLLGGDDDVDDPIGAGLEVYRACAGDIVRHLERILPEWVTT
ncbi:MAG: hypothetical protein ACKODX_21440 [Gemmata sp.]